MALNAKTAPMGGGLKIDLMDAGTYPTRLVGVVDCGLQPQSYDKEEKPPKQEIAFTYEFVDVFLKDEDGQELTDKPRWLTESMPLNNIESEKAKSTARYKALDPNNLFDGDFTRTIDTPVNVTIIHNPGKGKNTGKTFENIAAVSAMRPKDAERCPPLVNKPFLFDLDEPDLAVFQKLPKFLQDKIKSNLEYKGSKLESLLQGNKEATPPKVEKQAAAEDERPY